MSFTIITLRCSTLAPYQRANSCVFPAIWNYGHIKSSLAPRERQNQKNGSWLRGFSIRRKLRFVVYTQPEPSADPPPPSGPLSSFWKTWILGAILTFIVPFLSHKRGPFFKLIDKVESMVEKAEDATEAIEKIAEKVEKIADAIGDELPKSGKLRGVADFIEEAAEEAQKDAQLVEDILEKIEEIDKEVESMVERAEDATEAIEKIAEKVEKIADAIGDELPESGKLRGVADFIEEAAEEAQKDAQLVGDILEKIEEIDKEVEDFMEPKTKTPEDANDQD